MGYFKAINYWVLGGFGGEKDPVQAIKDAAAMGLDGLELTFPDSIKENITKEECNAILKAAKENKVEIRSLATGAYWGNSLSSNDKAERERAIKFTERYLEVASWLKVKLILVVPGAVDVGWDPSKPVVSYQDAWKNSTASLKKALKTAAKLKITICIENVWNKFLTSPVDFKLFIDQFRSKYIGAYFDVGNCVINGYPEHWIEILGKRIKAVHFKNFKRSDVGGVLHGFGDNLLEGDVNFANVLKALKAAKYKGPITAEMIPFSRLPDMVLPDMQLAASTAQAMKTLLQ